MSPLELHNVISCHVRVKACASDENGGDRGQRSERSLALTSSAFWAGTPSPRRSSRTRGPTGLTLKPGTPRMASRQHWSCSVCTPWSSRCSWRCGWPCRRHGGAIAASGAQRHLSSSSFALGPRRWPWTRPRRLAADARRPRALTTPHEEQGRLGVLGGFPLLRPIIHRVL